MYQPDDTGGLTLQQVADALRRGDWIDDNAFDRFFPDDLRLVSREHWTPLVVVARVAEWINALEIKSVVDIGSGAGKFCVAAALASDCRFAGIEQRPRLVDAARSIARLFGVEARVRMIEGTLADMAVPIAEAYYLFNPFGENLFAPEAHLDEDVELNQARYDRDVALMKDFFSRAPIGTYVINYNGFGGYMPRGYKEILVDREMPNMLRVWRKTGGAGPDLA